METCPTCGSPDVQHLGDFDNAPVGQPVEMVGTYECRACGQRFVGRTLNEASQSAAGS